MTGLPLLRTALVFGAFLTLACDSNSSQTNDSSPAQDGSVDTRALADGSGGEGQQVLDAPAPDTSTADVSKADTIPSVDGPVPDQRQLDQAAADNAPPPGCTHPTVTATCGGGWCDIPAGCFVMGTDNQEKCHYNTAKHDVTISRSFRIQQKEVTRAEFEALMGYGDGMTFGWITGEHAMDQRTWHEAAAYCNKLSVSLNLPTCYQCTGTNEAVTCQTKATYTGSKFYGCPGARLPTSAEWEYAYRAGTNTAYYNGDNQSCTGNDTNADAIAWYRQNSGSKGHQVGQKAANLWGIHDMAGNVSEWTEDWIHPPNTPDAVATDPLEDQASEFKVHRGGYWNDFASTLRAAAIAIAKPTAKKAGIRCVRPR